MRKNITKILALAMALAMLMPMPAQAKERTIEYTVKKGDTLWGISKENLGAGNRYKEIVAANQDSIKNPRLIIPGQKISITVIDDSEVTDEIKTFTLRGDDFQHGRMEPNSVYKIVANKGFEDYFFTAAPDVAWVDEDGLVHTKDAGRFYWWVLNENKDGWETGFSVQIAGDYDYAIWIGEEEELNNLEKTDKKIKSITSSDESIATVELRDGKPYLKGIKTGHCKVEAIYDDGSKESIDVSPTEDDFETWDKMVEDYINSLKK